MAKKGRLIVISGPAGVGKGTVCKVLLNLCPDICLSVSETTRPPRPGEIDGKDYFFVSTGDFEKGIVQGRYLEYDHHFDRYYGTPLDYVNQKRDQGKDVLLEIDVKGAQNVKKAVPDAVTVFLLPPSLEECQKRIIGRDSDSAEQLMLRKKRFPMEVQCASDYDYCVVNDVSDKAAETIIAILTAEKNKTQLWEDHIKTLLGEI